MKLGSGVELRSVFMGALILPVFLSSYGFGISSGNAIRAVSRGVQEKLPTREYPELVAHLVQKITWLDDHTTALNRSIDSRDQRMMKFVLDHGSKAFFRDEEGKFTHIYEYSRRLRNWEETETELALFQSEQASWVNVFDSKGRLPLTIAAGIEDHEDSAKIISSLLEHEAEVNVLAKTTYPQNSFWLVDSPASPLAHTVATLNVAGAKMLLDKGADPNLFNRDLRWGSGIETAPLYLALMQFNSEEGKELVELLLKYDAEMKESILNKVVHTGPLNALRFAIQSGFDVNRTGKDGETVIHNLVLSDSKPARKRLNILLQVPGIDLDIRNKRAETALMIAAKFGHLRAVRKLVRNGATTHLRNKDGHSARDLAQQRLAEAEKTEAKYLDNYRKIIRILEE